MDLRKIFDTYEDEIPKIAEVDKAEEIAEEIFDRVAAYDRELAFRADEVMGMLARAYEMKGFNGGLLAAGGAI